MATSYSNRLGTAPEEAVKAPCVVASTTNITLSGEQTIGTTAVVAGNRVLVAGQTDNTENGIYDAAAGAWSRSTDWNAAEDVISGQLVFVPTALYEASFTGSYAPGTTALTFAQVLVNESTNISYTSPHTGAVLSTVNNALRYLWHSVFDLMTTAQIADVQAGTKLVDVTTPLQNALNAQYPYFVPPGIYKVTAELVWKDSSNLIGASPNFELAYNKDIHTVIFYDGVGGANSCVMRMSEEAVGTNNPTSNLYNIRAENLIVDGNAKAEFGYYYYRFVYGETHSISALNCKEAGHCYTSGWSSTHYNPIAYSNEKNGIEIGNSRFAGINEIINSTLFVSPLSSNNGTGKTFNATTKKTEGHGFFVQASRGVTIENLIAELNDGAGMYLTSSAEQGGGPVNFIGGYFENNMNVAVGEARSPQQYELWIAYVSQMRHYEFKGTHFNSSFADYVKIEAAGTPGGPEDLLTFRNCYWAATPTIDSDTENFRVIDCSNTPTYANKIPVSVPYMDLGAARTLTANDSGRSFYLRLSAGFAVTLPAPAAGLKYRIYIGVAPSTGSYTLTTNASANVLFGTIFEALDGVGAIVSAQNTITFVSTVSLVGDWIELEADTGPNWLFTAHTGANGGIT